MNGESLLSIKEKENRQLLKVIPKTKLINNACDVLPSSKMRVKGF